MAKVRSNPKLRRRTFFREWRDHKNMTLEQVAEVIDVTPGALSQLERGITNYTQPMLEGLAFAYGCEPADLIMRDPRQESAIYSLWDHLKPETQKRALRLIRALAEEDGLAA